MKTPPIPISALPAWMRPRRRTFDYGLLLALAFGVVIALPLVARIGLPRHTAAELYEARSAQVARLARGGVLYSRWAPDANFLQGSPLFNYLPPLAHLLPGYHQAITESSPTDSIKLFMVLSIMAASGGMYVFARRRWGGRAGLLAALLYTLSGPIALALPYFYGELAALMALAALPWAAWGIDRVVQPSERWPIPVAAVALSALLLSDTRLALLGSGALVVIAASRWGRRSAVPIATLIIIVVGVTAFYWLPAIGERDHFSWQPASTPPYSGVISLAEVFAPFPLAEIGALNMPTYRGLGPLLGLLPLMAVIGWLIRRGRRENSPLPPDSAALLTYGLFLIGFASPAVAHLWPPADQFLAPLPYHAVMIAAFCLAAAGGGVAHLLNGLPPRRVRPIAFGALCLVICAVNYPAAFPPVWIPRESAGGIVAGLEQEISGFQAATLRQGVMLPSGLRQIAPPSNLIDDLQDGRYDGVDREAFPSRVDLALVERNPLGWRYIVNLNQGARVPFNLLAFPGWAASLSGQRMPVEAENGRLVLDLPTINGELTVSYDRTAQRDLAWGFTGFALLLLVLSARLPPVREGEITPLPPAFAQGEWAALIVVFALTLGGSLAIRQFPDRLFPLRAGPPPEMAPLPRFLQDGIDMLGYYLPDKTVTPGGHLQLTVYWQPARPLLTNNQSEVWLVSPVGPQTVARAVNRHSGGVPTLFWQLGRYVRDHFVLHIPPDLPEGDYVLQTVIGPCQIPSIVPCERLDGMDAYNPIGEVERGKITIPQVIRVRR